MDTCQRSKRQGLEGWQEIYTDFDSWICKFKRNTFSRSSDNLKKIVLEDSQSRILADSVKTDVVPTLEELIVKGLALKKLPNDEALISLRSFLNQDLIASCDYAVITSMKYTRSKL